MAKRAVGKGKTGQPGRFITLRSGRVIFIPVGRKTRWAEVRDRVKAERGEEKTTWGAPGDPPRQVRNAGWKNVRTKQAGDQKITTADNEGRYAIKVVERPGKEPKVEVRDTYDGRKIEGDWKGIPDPMMVVKAGKKDWTGYEYGRKRRPAGKPPLSPEEIEQRIEEKKAAVRGKKDWTGYEYGKKRE